MIKVGFIVNQVSEDPRSTRSRLASAKPYLWPLKYLPANFVQESLFPRFPLKRLHYATSDVITDVFGNQCIVEYWGVPRTSSQMMRDQPVGLVVEAGRYLEKMDCELIGLGAHTSIIGDKGVTVARELKAGVTTGNSLTCWMGVMGALEGAKLMGIDPMEATAAVLGAGGSIGGGAAKLLQNHVGSLLLAGHTSEPLYRTLSELNHDRARVVSDVRSAVKQAQIIITVTSSTTTLDLNPEDFLPGAVICDIARPRDVARWIVDARQDVLVVDGGLVSTRGANLNGDFGIAPATAYACMAETFILGLSGKTGDYSIGGELEMEKVLEIGRLAEVHGFSLEGLRSFDRQVTTEDIARIRERAERKLAGQRRIHV